MIEKSDLVIVIAEKEKWPELLEGMWQGRVLRHSGRLWDG
jgi:hypothetical protein